MSISDLVEARNLKPVSGELSLLDASDGCQIRILTVFGIPTIVYYLCWIPLIFTRPVCTVWSSKLMQA